MKQTREQDYSTAPSELLDDEALPTAQLIGYNHDADVPSAQVIEDAIPIPSADSSRAPEHDRRVASLATHRGLMQAEQELEEIQRANREVGAIQYFANARVQEANRAAAIQNRAEEMGLKKISKTEKYVPPPAKKEEFYAGTFGKEYEVSDYETRDYETRDYGTSEYKSVYDS
jgi:hypothetical protein